MPTLGRAQIVTDWAVGAENFFYRIKNIEFFIDRFNNRKESEFNPAPQTDTAASRDFLLARNASLASLFDHQRMDRNDRQLHDRVNSFFRFVNNPDQPHFIHFTDSGWFAEVDFEARYLSTPATLKILLVVELQREGAWVWAAKSLILEPQHRIERNDKAALFFDPSAHGTDFMSVRLKLNDPGWISQRLANKSDSSQVITRLLGEKKLVLDRIRSIRYHFLQLDGWVFTVQYVNRESKNSGWLIRDLTAVDSTGKSAYVKRLKD